MTVSAGLDTMGLVHPCPASNLQLKTVQDQVAHKKGLGNALCATNVGEHHVFARQSC